jgi:predicted nucleic acid-binding Zn ribbon protein
MERQLEASLASLLYASYKCDAIAEPEQRRPYASALLLFCSSALLLFCSSALPVKNLGPRP